MGCRLFAHPLHFIFSTARTFSPTSSQNPLVDPDYFLNFNQHCVRVDASISVEINYQLFAALNSIHTLTIVIGTEYMNQIELFCWSIDHKGVWRLHKVYLQGELKLRALTPKLTESTDWAIYYQTNTIWMSIHSNTDIVGKVRTQCRSYDLKKRLSIVPVFVFISESTSALFSPLFLFLLFLFFLGCHGCC